MQFECSLNGGDHSLLLSCIFRSRLLLGDAKVPCILSFPPDHLSIERIRNKRRQEERKNFTLTYLGSVRYNGSLHSSLTCHCIHFCFVKCCTSSKSEAIFPCTLANLI